MSRAEIAAEYAEVRNATDLPLATFLEDVDLAREKGWAIDVNGFVHGVTSIAAPIIDEHGQLRFTVTATMFSGQHDPAVIEAIGRETRDLAFYVSSRIYGSARP
jgi:DNA-binding IclR family transcriptional regulator